MKDRITRAKNFVRTHNHGIATAGGLVVGAALSYRFLNPQEALLQLRLTPEQATALMADPKACVQYETARQIIHVFVPQND